MWPLYLHLYKVHTIRGKQKTRESAVHPRCFPFISTIHIDMKIVAVVLLSIIPLIQVNTFRLNYDFLPNLNAFLKRVRRIQVIVKMKLCLTLYLIKWHFMLRNTILNDISVKVNRQKLVFTLLILNDNILNFN